jgi:pimeloyl-ACP methyl ester carboxylesterase
MRPVRGKAKEAPGLEKPSAAQDGPVVLVGHSYGGVVISEAGTDPKVDRLVYVAAFAPDAGESVRR